MENLKRLSKKEIYILYEAGPDALGEVINGLIDIIIQQQQEIIMLKERLKKLEEQINKNSKNSSKPPSTDGFNKPKSLRKKSLKPNGGQKGHEGHTLKQTDRPDKIIVHEVSTCKECSHSLNEIEPTVSEKRQVFGFEIKKVVTEHQAIEKICPQCGIKNKSIFPDDVQCHVQYGSEVKAVATYLSQYQLLPQERICDFFDDIVGIRPSEATIIGFNNSVYDKLELVEERIKQLLIEAPVVNFDETGLSVEGKTNWIHSASTDKLTHYGVHPKRGRKAMDETGILPEYHGVAVHDFWKPYLKYGNCQHSLCNAHLLRELTAVFENDEKQKWASDMISLLCEIKEAVSQSKTNTDRVSLTSLEISFFKDAYAQILGRGFKLNEQLNIAKQIENIPGKRGRKKQSKAKNLLDRFKQYEDDILRFMYDFNVPFDNNLAERDLRMIKVKQKISGTFRSKHGSNVFARIRGYISTIRKNNMSVIETIKDALKGKPYLPEPIDTS